MFLDFHARRIAGNELRSAQTMLRLWEGRRAVSPHGTLAWKRAVKGIETAHAKIAAFTAASLCQHTWQTPLVSQVYLCSKCKLEIPFEDAHLRPISNNFTKDT